jgi:hypothetical protein
MSDDIEAVFFWRDAHKSWRAQHHKVVEGYVTARGKIRPAVAFADKAYGDSVDHFYDSIFYVLYNGTETYAGARVAATFTPREN